MWTRFVEFNLFLLIIFGKKNWVFYYCFFFFFFFCVCSLKIYLSFHNCTDSELGVAKFVEFICYIYVDDGDFLGVPFFHTLHMLTIIPQVSTSEIFDYLY